MSEALARAESIRRALVVTGSDGLDEVTLDGPTRVRIVESGRIREEILEPRKTSDYGGSRPASSRSRAPTRVPGCCGGCSRASRGPVREIVLANAAASLWTVAPVPLPRGGRRARRGRSTRGPRRGSSSAGRGSPGVRVESRASLGPAAGDERTRTLTELPLSAIPGRTIPGQVLWLAAPVFVEQSLLYLIGLSDTILAGRYLSAEHLAGVTVVELPALVPGDALHRRLDRRDGPGLPVDRGRAGRRGEPVLRPGLRRGPRASASWPWSLVQVLAPRIVAGMNLTGLAAESATRFLRIVGAVTPLLACTTVGNACLRGAGDTRTGMKVMVLMNVVNVGLSWLLAVGWGPIPALGLTGIATGTACGEGIGGAVILGLLIRGRSGLRITRASLTPDPAPDRAGSCGSACRRPGRA